ncbi:MAG: HD-GYP domain-containing protein [Vicinamibacterales bacterium]
MTPPAGNVAAPASRRTQVEQPLPHDPLPLLRAFASLRRLTGMYPAGHPTIGRKVDEIDAIVQRHLQDSPALRIDFIRGDIYLDGEAFRFEASLAPEIVAEMIELGIHSIHIHPGVSRDELRQVGEFLWQMGEGRGGEPVAAELARRGVSHVTLGRIVPLDTRWRAMEWPDRPTGPLDPAYAESLAVAEQTFEDVRAGRGLDVVSVGDLVQLLVHRVARSNAALAQILAVKHYENLTYCHSVNVAMLALLLARRVGFDEDQTTALVEAALLHDIGKTRVPLEILKKPGALDKLERRTIETHTVLGGEILVEVEGVRPLTPTVALEHHRTPKGGGYPALGDHPPHALTQIVAVADIYEAMTGARSYHVPSQPEHACLVLARLAGEKLNGALVKAFVNAITFFPLGTLVRTNRDETGVVVRTNPSDPLHPVIVCPTVWPDGPRREIDTSSRDASGQYERHIVESLRPRDGEVDITSFFPVAD